jgi:hypothetical protein
MTHEALERAAAAERSAVEARSELEQARLEQGRAPRDPAVRRSRHDDPKQIERVQKLYEEIDNLTRARERAADALPRLRSLPARKDPLTSVTAP